MFFGEYDAIFPMQAGKDEYDAVFTSLGISPVEYEVDMSIGHVVDCRMFEVMMAYVADGTVTAVTDYEACAEEEDDKDFDEAVTQYGTMGFLTIAMGAGAFFFWPFVLANAIWLAPAALGVLFIGNSLASPDKGSWEDWEDWDEENYDDWDKDE